MAAVKRFKLQYTNSDGERVTDEPRCMITADGKHKSLVIGDSKVLATVTYDTPDATLWQQAKERALGGTRN
jgi:hypothetical protein